jgi:predicted alpha/beta-fold hydrolase
MRNFLIRNVPTVTREYSPAPLLSHGILQTAFAIIRRLPTNHVTLKYDREILTLRDGGEIGVDFLPTTTPKNG